MAKNKDKKWQYTRVMPLGPLRGRGGAGAGESLRGTGTHARKARWGWRKFGYRAPAMLAECLFCRRGHTWSPPTTLLIVSDTQTGAALAWDSLEGYGMAAFDRAPNSLSYTHSLDGVAWTAIEPVFEAGTGGFYPSLAMDPINHEPVVAFYVGCQ